MKQTKLFFVDLDGTLLDERHNGKMGISQTNKDAITKAMNDGIHIVISTGRLGKVAEHWLKESGIDYAITGNGSKIIDKDLNVLKQLDIPMETMDSIVSFCEDNGLAMKKDTTRIAYGVKTAIHENIANDLNYEIRDNYDVPQASGIKLIIWGYDPKGNKAMADKMMKAIPGISAVIAERGRTIEVTHKEANKGLGNKFIMDLLNIDKEHTAHIGDTMNDFPAIEHVGKFIAMGNGAYDLLHAAEFVGPDHFDNGVARVLAGEYKKNPYKKK